MLRLYNDEKLTLKQIGEVYKISGARVSQILTNVGYTPRPSGFQKKEGTPETLYYTVKVVRTQTKYVEVEAKNEKEAREKAERVFFGDGLPMRTKLRATVCRFEYD
jgi:Sigma-70, region 4